MKFFERRWRAIAAFTVLGCGVSAGAPALTTISDILYKADGTRFTGTVTIAWNNFSTADQSTFPAQAVTVEVSSGAFKVQLAPTTTASPGANYMVRYSSQGKFQFTEIWSVPPSTVALKVRDVRVGTGSVVGPPPVLTQLEIGDISGLAGELNDRPQRGSNYGPSRAAIINSAGQIDAVAGNATDCVRVDGSSVPCVTDGGTPNTANSVAFADGETPAGTVNGSNAVFTIANAPQPAASLALYRNGVLMKPGDDFTLNGASVTFAAAGVPQNGDILTASYRYAVSSGIGAAVAANFIDAETPAGNVNAQNAAFALAQAPAPPASLQLYRNGILMKQGADYALAGNTVTFVAAAVPQTGDLLLASYRYGSASSSTAAIASSYYAGPQVLCSAAGNATAATNPAPLGSCLIPAGALAIGDRVEIRFEYAHTGASSGFAVQLKWGASVLLSRSISAADTALSGRVDAGIFSGGAQWSSQSWGTAAAMATGSGTAAESLDAITVGFSGSLTGGGGDQLALRNYTVLRYPAQL